VPLDLIRPRIGGKAGTLVSGIGAFADVTQFFGMADFPSLREIDIDSGKDQGVGAGIQNPPDVSVELLVIGLFGIVKPSAEGTGAGEFVEIVRAEKKGYGEEPITRLRKIAVVALLCKIGHICQAVCRVAIDKKGRGVVENFYFRCYTSFHTSLHDPLFLSLYHVWGDKTSEK
jgi:hypothetical protein